MYVFMEKKVKIVLKVKFVLRFYDSQTTGVMLSAVSLPNHTFTGQTYFSKRLTNIYLEYKESIYFILSIFIYLFIFFVKGNSH